MELTTLLVLGLTVAIIKEILEKKDK